MRVFPPEFSELLNSQGRSVIDSSPGRTRAGRGFFTVLDGIMEPDTAAACVELLDSHLYPLLRPMVQRIPRNSISSMTKNYGEKLPKTNSIKTCFLQSKRYRAYRHAERIGLIEMLRSASIRRFAESVTGLELSGGTHQAICYEHGDYSGPHNDHHPEFKRLKNGYVDLHIMFGNDAVAHQWIVYEQDRHLNRIRNVNLQGAVSVYRLPFWHYTTPLTGKPGREAEARRWLLLVSFDIVRGTRAAQA